MNGAYSGHASCPVAQCWDKPWVNWAMLGPQLFKFLAAYLGGQLIVPPPFSSSLGSDWRMATRKSRQSDTTFWMQGGSRPELPIRALSATRLTVRRSALVVDAWRPEFTKIGLLALILLIRGSRGLEGRG